ncbi:aldo/keto reductase [Amycolatopsis sp. K13G38]|uniref:Aldo/keto reductase n=1 Tax=Amycolatopsis acididurans TaxID=2724524 RepID=A0ABX1JI35_9PSEU|nr:aldo/keto reductase [Amycolatopsis acididurans]NKQ57907.1 aldo/keto reductase [Amycolatopsis acididurans]
MQKPDFPLVLGGNVFGWTADRETSFEVLDAFVEAGGTHIDTADSYSQWAPGNEGGESETILGAWLADHGAGTTIASKVGQSKHRPGLAPDNIRAALADSLRRLGRDSLDLYYAHFDDEDRPIEEIARTFSRVREEGLIGAIGVSNFSADRIAAWLQIAEREGWHAPTVIQKEYSLVERGIEADIVPLAREHGLSVLTYYSLGRGFLTGKYRDDTPVADSPRAGIAAGYLDDRGRAVLAALDDVSARHGTVPAAIALAWLATRPQVGGVIASGRNTAQLSDILAAARVRLSADDVALLDQASAPVATPH